MAKLSSFQRQGRMSKVQFQNSENTKPKNKNLLKDKDFQNKEITFEDSSK